jgi:N-acetylglucosamine kinase-like BadF-type ATPase
MTGPVLAVDGGNSKADVALVGADGSLLTAVRAPTISHQAVGLDEAARRFASLVRQVRSEAGARASGAPPWQAVVACLAGADYPEDIRRLRRAFAPTIGDATDGAALILNDTFAVLRAGASRPWGIALICGQGINGAAVGVTGRRIRFAGVGDISGDWGGAGGVGMAGLAAAVRGQDGRGPRTALERTIPATVGLHRPDAVTHAYYTGRLDEARVGELAPTVFATAIDGDPVARAIIDRLADELSGMAAALGRRAGLLRRDPEVVLGGSVFRTHDRAFHERLRDGVVAAIPRATIVRLATPPVAGAALIGLDRLAPAGAVDDASAERVREALAAWSATARVVTAS